MRNKYHCPRLKWELLGELTRRKASAANVIPHSFNEHPPSTNSVPGNSLGPGHRAQAQSLSSEEIDPLPEVPRS